MESTNLKKGDKIILKKSTKSYEQYEGKILEILSVHSNSSGVFYHLCDPNSNNPTTHIAYAYVCTDDFCLADRKEHAKYIKEQIKREELKLKELKEEKFRLENFETDEDEVAYKLDKILKASRSGGAKKIAKILKGLKKTDYL